MTKYRSRILIMALIAMAFTISTVHAQNTTWEVKEIESGADDGYISETGNKFFITPWVQVKSKSYSLTSYFAFRNLTLPANATILNATLQFTAPPPTTFAPNATLDVTIYGLKYGDLTSWDPTPDLQSYPSTIAATDFDTTPLSFGAQINVTVTDQVKEIYDMFSWNSGNDMGFRIRSVFEPSILSDRYQVGYEYNPSNALKLYIEYAPANDTAIYYKGFLITESTGASGNFLQYDEVDEDGVFDVSSNLVEGYGDFFDFDDESLTQSIPVEFSTFETTFSLKVTNVTDFTSIYLMAMGNRTTITFGDALKGGGNAFMLRVGSRGIPADPSVSIYGVFNDAGGPENTVTKNLVQDVKYYYNLTNDGSFYRIEVYNDPAMTSLNKSIVHAVDGTPVYGGVNHSFYALVNIGGGSTQFGDIGFELSDLKTTFTSVRYSVYDENGTQINSTCISAATSIEDVQACIDAIVGQTPDDPNPPGTTWPDEGFGVLTRFNLRFILWGVGWFLIIVPLIIMAIKSWPLKIYLIFLLCMALGVALQWSIGSI